MRCPRWSRPLARRHAGRLPAAPAAARVFMRLRWLGEYPSWTENDDADEQLGEMQRVVQCFEGVS